MSIESDKVAKDTAVGADGKTFNEEFRKDVMALYMSGGSSEAERNANFTKEAEKINQQLIAQGFPDLSISGVIEGNGNSFLIEHNKADNTRTDYYENGKVDVVPEEKLSPLQRRLMEDPRRVEPPEAVHRDELPGRGGSGRNGLLPQPN